jgi:WD40 repeat protein
VLQGHTSEVTAVAFSPDSRLLVSASGDSTVRFWDPSTGRSRSILKPSGQKPSAFSFLSLAFHPRGRLLAAGALDGTIDLVDVRAGRRVHRWEGQGIVCSLAFSPDGRLLASAEAPGLAAADVLPIRVREAATGRLVRVLKGGKGWASSVRFSPDGRFLAAADSDGIRLWDVESGRTHRMVKGHENAYVLAYSPDGQFLATRAVGESVRLWEAGTGQVLREVREPTPLSAMTSTGAVFAMGDAMDTITFTPDSQWLVWGDVDRQVHLWNVRAGYAGPVLKGHTSFVSTVAVSGDSQLLASGSWDGTIRLWKLGR